ncbi:MANSC domain-containing protein 1 [Microcaecilia unicolor]|uniref:MANSC domain-containing protein 1 n=1 Tax=Microcaecilia unicolor TaxID=1415580 RepID=A0A6P7YZL0_9AMPH|nr:MANSC domain-containing protein 1 [Microcaecilia unicolor]XP_030070383.1 MANSC domain-containing protein 1 [Microcaecilia unicolor]XP_030070384.1 MANSC domain-containing protein 1 [Microcaecilia unicolor]XP_030070385.1 MANSC domain-containing protein 1 [Microcaecilia unicolor]
MGSQTNWCCSSVLLLLVCMSPVLCTSQRCSTERIVDFIIDVKNALSEGVKINEQIHTSTEEACRDLCCTHENISESKNCNFMTFDAQKAKNLPNCYLFYCPTTEACPLKPSIGLVSYRIVQDKQHLEEDLSIPENSSSSQTNSSASKHPASKHNSTSNLQKSISAPILDLEEDVDKQLKNTDSSHKKIISPNEEYEEHQNSSNSTESLKLSLFEILSTKAPVAARPTTSSVLPKTLLTTTNQATNTTSQATTTFVTTTTQATTMYIATTTPKTTTIQPTTTSFITTTAQATTMSTTSTTTPKTTTIQPTTTKTTTQPTTITTSIITQLPTLTSSSTVTPTVRLTTRIISTTASNYPVPKKNKIGSLRSSIRPPTTGTKSATRAVSSSSIPLANINSAGSWKSINQHTRLINSKENQIVNNKGGENSPSLQSSDKSGLIAALCFGVAFLLLIMGLVGRSALESLQRRHYSRLDYLINGMYVDT